MMYFSLISLSLLCWAGISIINEYADSLPHPEYILRPAADATYVQCISLIGVIKFSPNSCRSQWVQAELARSHGSTPQDEEILALYRPTFSRDSTSSKGLGPQSYNSKVNNDEIDSILAKPFIYNDQTTQTTRSCLIQDFGESRLKGAWYEVIIDGDEDAEPLTISASEMREILDGRVLE